MGGSTLTLDEPLDRLILLSSPNPADKIVALAGGTHQDILGALEDSQAKTMVGAYRKSRQQIGSTLNKLWNDTFGSGLAPEPKHVIAWARNQELLSQVDSHLDQLGYTTQALQGQAFSAGAELGFQHANTELGMAVHDFGGAGVIGKSIFGNLNTLVPDLGMAAAVNDTQNLSDTLRAAVHSELTQGAILGEGIRKIQARLDTVLHGATVPAGSRAELISRWATIKGYNAAGDQAINDAAQHIPGLQKMWLVTKDERTCPHCMAHFGEVVDAGDEFNADRTFAGTPPKIYGGVLDYPPLHPRCRCTITAWHPRWNAIATLPPAELEAQAQTLAQRNGFAPKSFTPGVKPLPGTLRATRAGRQVIRAQSIASIPESVRQQAMSKFLTCWVGGGPK